MLEKKIYSLSHKQKLMNFCLRKIEEIDEDITEMDEDLLRADPYKNQTLSGKAR